MQAWSLFIAKFLAIQPSSSVISRVCLLKCDQKAANSVPGFNLFDCAVVLENLLDLLR
eukprot:CAMPEP_0115136676 /NCGR_PEP_ID=MMETSP0227-20121206/56522_1 /TAXON_ID=89957 /ORGANISM="Polarella glacialis, Strain CCMP 1383" /LENGTH=57 /DNA_ID=CAMNT_0002543769 /DNA_START=359 /DNA_END=532 /DNA_ORIENTATION=-